MKRIGSCIVIVAILMCVVPAFATDNFNSILDTSDNVKLDYANTSEFYSSDVINKSVDMPDTTLQVILDTDISTTTLVSPMSSCDQVWIQVIDEYCQGYNVYVDGNYVLTEGGSGGVLDGYCRFWVTPGYHTVKLTLNGKSVSKGLNWQCGYEYKWTSMNDMDPHWCEGGGGGGDCDNPPTVTFDKTTYYEGDTVHATVSTTHSSVYYKIKDCSGTVRKTGHTSGGTISYTIPDGSTSSCCYWTICFYWDEGGTPTPSPLGPLEAAGNVTVGSYQCSKCYPFYVCPDTCDAYVVIEDKVCFGYDVYVDGVRQFTEGQGTTPDGYCSFTVSEGYHTIKIQKDGCSEIVFRYQYFQCNGQYKKTLQTYWCDCNKPDLVIQDISWYPSNPDKEDTVTYTVTIKNQGAGSAGSSTVKYYIDGSYVASDSVPSLSAGSTSTQTFTWTADTCGNVQVKAVADANNAVTESNEGNNGRTEKVSISCGPDLIVLDFWWSPPNPKQGDKMTFYVEVKNIGETSAGSSTVELNYSFDGGYIAFSASVPALSAGDTTTIQFPTTWTLYECGNLPLRAIADVDDDIEESNEGNNERTETMSVTCVKPDLIIHDISWYPSNPEQGDTVTYTVTIENQGAGSAGSSTVKYYIDGSYVASDSVPSLSSGSTSTQTFTWTAKCGNVQVKAVADANNAVTESNEGNNDRTETVNIPCDPDLIIQDISWSPSSPKQGDTITFTVKIKNNGDANAESSHAKLLIDGTEITTVSVGALNAGSSITKTFSWTASGCDDHTVKAIADCNNEVTESDEGNNEGTATLNIPCEKPDLTVTDLTWSPKQPKLGDTIAFHYTIKNIGKGVATESNAGCFVENSSNRIIIAHEAIKMPDLNPEQTFSHTFYWTPKRYEEVLIVASALTAGDSDLDNNILEKRLEIYPSKEEKPDLISDSSMAPEEPKVGDEVTFVATVKNIGKGIAEESSFLAIVLNFDAKNKRLFKIADTCPSLKPGESHTYTKKAKIENCGEYLFLAGADTERKIDESNDENNGDSISFTVSCPNLKSIGITGPDKIKAGERKQWQAYGLYSDGSQKELTRQVSWTVVASDILQNIGTGEFKGLKGGDATIKLTYEGKSASKRVTVIEKTNQPPKASFTYKKDGLTVRFTSTSSDPDGEIKEYLWFFVEDVGMSTQRISKPEHTYLHAGKYEVILLVWDDKGAAAAHSEEVTVTEKNNEKPDLIIQDISWNPEDPESGDPVNFTITVKNTGPKDVDSTIYVDFETGGTQQPRKKVADSLKSGETATVTYNGILKKYCLLYLAQATVDPDNTIAERDGNNNYKSETVNIVKKYALIVGINNYRGEKDVHASVNDAKNIYNLLKKGYKYDNVKLLTDEDATHNNITNQLSNFSNKADFNDIFVFYFAGHGGYSKSDLWEYVSTHDYYQPHDTQFAEIFDNFEGTVICIFESCSSGGMTYDTDDWNGKSGIDRDNAIVLMSCGASEECWERRDQTFFGDWHWIYSDNLYKAFTSKRTDADLNDDPRISLEEAHNYAREKTIEESGRDIRFPTFHPQIMDHYKSKSHPEAYCHFSRHPINSEFING